MTVNTTEHDKSTVENILPTHTLEHDWECKVSPVPPPRPVRGQLLCPIQAESFFMIESLM